MTYTHDAQHEADLLGHRIRMLLRDVPTTLAMAEPTIRPASYDAGRSSEAKLPINPDLAEATRHLKAILASWALLVGEERHVPIGCEDSPTGIAHWLQAHAEWLGRHPAGQDCEDEIREALRGVERCCYQGPDSRVFVTMHDGYPVYAKEGQPVAYAPDGTAYDVAEERAQLQERLLSQWLPESLCAAVIAHHYGFTVTGKQIRDWRRHDGEKAIDWARKRGSQWVYLVGRVLTYSKPGGRARSSKKLAASRTSA